MQQTRIKRKQWIFFSVSGPNYYRFESDLRCLMVPSLLIILFTKCNKGNLKPGKLFSHADAWPMTESSAVCMYLIYLYLLILANRVFLQTIESINKYEKYIEVRVRWFYEAQLVKRAVILAWPCPWSLAVSFPVP